MQKPSSNMLRAGSAIVALAGYLISEATRRQEIEEAIDEALEKRRQPATLTPPPPTV